MFKTNKQGNGGCDNIKSGTEKLILRVKIAGFHPNEIKILKSTKAVNVCEVVTFLVARFLY